ncbi:MAG: hypothetical protein P9M02_05705 [Candidatus Susulua stagnicola]|nr:hypothetical protein [Candidatus Susulua stagnicola]
MRLRFIIISCLILFFVSGCFFLPESLKTLKSVGDSQNEIEIYLANQAKLFNKLLIDLRSECLEQGVSKESFINLYGEPILAKEVIDPPGGVRLLYRYPTEYFKSDRVYLYFNQKENLVRWEYKPYKNEF